MTKVLKTWAEASKRSGGGGHPSRSGGGAGVDASAGASRDEVGCDGASTDATKCGATPSLSRATHVVNGQAYRFRTVLVDPPRAGLDDATRSHVRRYRNILCVVYPFTGSSVCLLLFVMIVCVIRRFACSLSSLLLFSTCFPRCVVSSSACPSYQNPLNGSTFSDHTDFLR